MGKQTGLEITVEKKKIHKCKFNFQKFETVEEMANHIFLD